MCQKKIICTNTAGFHNGFAGVRVQMNGMSKEKWSLIIHLPLNVEKNGCF